jgi:hypothetical protein
MKTITIRFISDILFEPDPVSLDVRLKKRVNKVIAKYSIYTMMLNKPF